MGKLTTHVLDVSNGIPAAGLRIGFHCVTAGEAMSDALKEQLSSPNPGMKFRSSPPGDVLMRLKEPFTTGPDGRLAVPIAEGDRFKAGVYTLTFHIGEYFRSRGERLPDPVFFEEAVITFGIASPDQHYHVPLLITPWSYSVYRGG